MYHKQQSTEPTRSYHFYILVLVTQIDLNSDLKFDFLLSNPKLSITLKTKKDYSLSENSLYVIIYDISN